MIILRKKHFLALVALVLMCAGISLASAWTAPTQDPPGGNVSAPVNVGSGSQVKSGSLGVDYFASYNNTSLATLGGRVGIGTANPASVLHVVTGGREARIGDNGAIELIDATDNVTFIDFKNLNTEDYDQRVLSDSASNFLAFYTAGSERMRVTSAGNVGIGTTSPSQKLSVNGNVVADGFFHNSDERLKENIRTISGLDIISKLRGVFFDWKKDGTKSAGVIAQEVEAVLPEAVHTDAEGMKSVDYDALIAPLIEAVKEQQAEIEELKKEIEALKNAR